MTKDELKETFLDEVSSIVADLLEKYKGIPEVTLLITASIIPEDIEKDIPVFSGIIGQEENLCILAQALQADEETGIYFADQEDDEDQNYLLN